MDMKLQPPGVENEFVSKNMVEVAVGIKQQNRSKSCLFNARF
jgi:hypothetical protein